MESFATSPGRNEMPKEERLSSSFFLDGEGEDVVLGRRRTVILVDGGARKERAVRMAVPSSPAPRMRIFEDIAYLEAKVLRRKSYREAFS